MKKTGKLILVLFIMAVFLFNYPVLAQNPSLTDKQTQTIEKEITTAMKDWLIPGMAVAIIKDGRVVYTKCFGYRDLEKKLKVTPETQFAIGSCTKAFTAFAAGLLIDEGKLCWETPVINYLPEFRLSDPVATQMTTIKDLLTHRTGFHRSAGEFAFFCLTDRKQIYRSAKYFKPNKTFRESFQYSNLGYTLAGWVEERISGKTWEDLVNDKIFNPLQMTSSNFSVETMKKTPNYAQTHGIDPSGKIIAIELTNYDVFAPAGSINSTVLDMSKWLLLHMNEGKLRDKQLIARQTLKEIMLPQIVMPEKPVNVKEIGSSSYGMGWVIDTYRGHKVIWHTGGVIGSRSYVGFIPEKKIGVILLLNQHDDYMHNFIPLVIYDQLLNLEPIDWNKRFLKKVQEDYNTLMAMQKEKKTEFPKNTKPSHLPADYSGTYKNPAYTDIAINLENGQLTGKFSRYEFKLNHLYYDVFQAEKIKSSSYYHIIDGLRFQFHTDINGKISSFSIFSFGREPIVYTKIIASPK